MLCLFGAIGTLAAGCEHSYPQVIVVNKTAEHIQLRNVSFNGCLWSPVLAYGEATSPGRCLPGEDRVHFQKLDALAYRERCLEVEEDTENEEGCGAPLWFNYQTVAVVRVSYGELHVIEVTLEDMEQDFSVPGPYGH